MTVHPEPEWVLALVTALTDHHEQDRADRWHVTDAPAEFIQTQLKAIVGVELLVERVEGKAKLSQNRSDADRAGVVAGLRADDRRDAGAVADAMQIALGDQAG